MPQDARDAQGHACEVGKRVSYKHLGGIPVEQEKPEGVEGQGQHQIGGEEVSVADVRDGARRARQLNHVVQQHRTRNDKRLSGLQAVDASQDIDGIAAEDDQRHKVDAVDQTQLEVAREMQHRHQRFRNNHARPTAVRRHQWQRREARQQQLDPPWDVQHVVRKAQEKHEADGGQCRIVIHEPRVGSARKREGTEVKPAPGEVVHKRCDVVVVQELEEDQTHEEHNPRSEAKRLGNVLFALL
mmetsp:Transcript_836/g.2305  ORF Transcript_836/g.2305 Transcript_836/m.2305 type:complete len:242 (+) Transcript_836:1652-2377(+)